MKTPITILATILFVMAGCGGNKQAGDDLITVDVTASYPKKELILQDFIDVEYIPLETSDEFLCQGFVQDIGKEIILVKNRNDDGDIFVFDRTGKALRKINRKGQGGEEYTFILGITLDEENNEMFINDHYARRIQVYDLHGNYKRSLKHKESPKNLFYTQVFNYNEDNLICYDNYNEEIPYVIVSKQDGSITRDIEIPFKEKRHLQATKKDEASNMTYTVTPGHYRSINMFKGDWMLIELSSDTVYTLLPDYSLRPFIVRTPPIESMIPEIYLIPRFFSDRYYFMETIENVYSFDTNEGFSRTFLMYDKQEKAFFKYTVYNGDYSVKKEIYMNAFRAVNHEIESWYPLEAHQLVNAFEKGELKGRLKEIAAELDEESNPVIMIAKHKK